MTDQPATTTRFTPRELPYAYDALAPAISEETMRYHHDKHYTCLLYTSDAADD